jgi:5-methylcytosine-specific restriction endonuclease McrA
VLRQSLAIEFLETAVEAPKERLAVILMFRGLSDHDLLVEVKRLADGERQVTAQLVASLAELDGRRLYLSEGCSSLFTYCTHVLHLSEHAAYGRIGAARAARCFPVILHRLAEGSITLTTVGLLAPHLTAENHLALLDAARHRSKRDVEVLVAELRPQPPVPSLIRKVPSATNNRRASSVPTTASASPMTAFPIDTLSQPFLRPSPTEEPRVPLPPPAPAGPVLDRPARGAVIKPLTPARYKMQMTVGAETVGKLRRVQDLMRHSVPDGDPATILDRALTLLLEHLERTKVAAVATPRASARTTSRSRYIPAAVRRAVWARDEGRCAFVGPEGRCTERGFVEFHHVVPYAIGGQATIDLISLRCRAHNQHEADGFELRSPFLARERAHAAYGYELGPDRVPTSATRPHAARLNSCLFGPPIVIRNGD